jgi:hypothetical protein
VPALSTIIIGDVAQPEHSRCGGSHRADLCASAIFITATLPKAEEAEAGKTKSAKTG